MDLKILNKKENPLLHREDIDFEVNNAKTTPSIKDLREQIAASSGSKKELVVVRVANPLYGKHKVSGNAKIYENPEIMKRIEQEYVIARNEGTKKKAKEKEETVPYEGKKQESKKPEAKPDAKAEDSGKEESKEKPEEADKEKK